MSNPISPLSIARQLSLSNTAGEQSRVRLRRDIAGLSEQLSSGKRINRASDDPAGFEQARRLDLLSKELSQYQRSIGAATKWNNATQNNLDTIIERFARAQELATQAANDTLNDGDRAAIATELRSLRGEVIDRLNAKLGDEYLFAGNATQDPPFDAATGAPNAGYNAIDDARNRTIGPDQQLKVNITGEEIHQMDSGDSIVDALDNLIDAVDPTTPNPPPLGGGPAPADPSDAIQNGLDAVTQARDYVINQGTRAGLIAQRLESATSQLDSAALQADARRSELEDVDFAEAISTLQRKQTSLQAALQVTARVKQVSLADFL